MTELWYKKPAILFNDMNQFFPNNDLSREEKINSMARFALYYSILLIVTKQDTKWLSISLIILLVSILLGDSEKFTSTDKTISKEICQRPTRDNPFMNYTLGDLLNKPQRPKACKYDDVKDEMRKEFRSTIYTDTTDIWGKYISDRNFYIMPNTEIVNDQTGFAKWCFGNSGECKITGKNCLKIRDPRYHRGRITNIENE